jgi:hypothetical protein
MGAALLVKPAAKARFSVLTFGIAQIAMDVEPGIGMLLGWEVLHGQSHTVLGALLIACLVAWIAPLICTPILQRYNHEVRHYKQDWLEEPPQMDKYAVWAGALFGTFSHIVLDSLMHHDIHPLAPFSDTNPLMDLVTHDGVYQWCVLMGAVGCAWWLRTKLKMRRDNQTTQSESKPQAQKSAVLVLTLALASLVAATDAFVYGAPFLIVFLLIPFLLASPVLIVMAVSSRGLQPLKAVGGVVLLAVATVHFCSWLDDLAQRHSQPVIDAIDRYHADTGSYPQSLEVLMPRYIAALPELKPVANQPKLEYRMVEAQPELSFRTGFAFSIRVYEFANRSWHSYD